MTWEYRYTIARAANPKQGSVGASGIDYSLFTPCSGNKDCGTCKHITDVMSNNKDEKGSVVDKDAHSIHKYILDAHQNKVPTLAEQMKPQLVLTAAKEEPWDKEDPDHGKHNKLTPEQKAKAKARAKSHGRPYPNWVDNAWASKQ